ncbi:MAG: hypothetical protein CM15mL3_0060 [Kanaloavirus sp.]|nr:MAG: hypothetical protein CM15mL3_0060 [Kanaloavirus sp.]
MAYHITKQSRMSGIGTMYYADNNRWTDVYENRKVYPTLFQDPEQDKNTTYTDKWGNTMTPHWWKQDSIVDES